MPVPGAPYNIICSGCSLWSIGKNSLLLFIKGDKLGIILSKLLIIISACVSEIEASPPWSFNVLPSLNQLLISERLIGLSNLCTQRYTALLVCKSGKIK